MAGVVLAMALGAWAPPAVAQESNPVQRVMRLFDPFQPASQPTSAPIDLSRIKTIDDARALYNKGKYDQGAQAFRKFLGGDGPPVQAGIGLSDCLAMRGRSTEAVDALNKVADKADKDVRWHVALAERLADIGEYDKALPAARKALTLQEDYAPAILTLGRLLETTGRKADAVATYKTIDKSLAGEAYRNDPASLVAIGLVMDRLAILTGQKASEQAQNILGNYLQRSYLDVDKNYWPGRIAAGMFLLSKHRPADASAEFQGANRLNPNIPELAVGMAAIMLEKWEFERAEGILKQGLAINPSSPELLVMRATMLLQWRKLDQVEPVLQKALKANPNHLEALSLLVALHIRLGEPDKAKPYIERIEKIHNGPYAEMYLAVGDWLSANRQFDLADEYLRKATELAPELADPWSSLGQVDLQRGREDKALEWLERAHEIDNFRADVVNYINLIKTMQRDFDTRETEHFILKADRKFDAVLLDQMARYLETIHPEICGDFNYFPKAKAVIEVFPTHEGFSLRITGKGWIGTVGASTGQVIVLAAPNSERSPIFGRFNWATVLRHEYTHTITLAASNNRIPHWFTEALAVFEQPDRRNFQAVQMLVQATRAGRLFTVQEMDWGFVRPRRAGDRELAYAQAEWTAEYIIARYGYESIVKMIEGFRDGLTQAQVFQKVLGSAEGTFNDEFRAWAKEQVAQWGFDGQPAPEVVASVQAARDNPNDPDAQATLAKAFLARSKFTEAQEAALKALAMKDDCAGALRVLANIALHKKDMDKAADYAARLEQADPKSALAPRILAEVYLEKRQFAPAIAALERLKIRLPLDPWSYEELAKLYVQLGQADRALPNLIEINRHDLRDPKWARQIAEIYRDQGKMDEALASYEQVLQINPYDATVYETMAALHLRRKEYGPAIRLANNAVQVSPGSAGSWERLSVVYYRAAQATGDRDKYDQGLTAADKAIALDPKSQATQIKAAIEQALATQPAK